MNNINVDSALLTGLIERWRPETHTFHLPIGEMTITLQDVSCLWGLPIRGLPVSGVSDGDWIALANECFGDGVGSNLMKPKKRSRDGDDAVYSISGYAINLKCLRDKFIAMPDGLDEPTEEQVHQYTRAYILDLFGSMLFPDSSGDSVPAMYLQFIRDLDAPGHYNWGGAVLAVLYRTLCWAVTHKAKTIWGPVVLLQHWAWTRLPMGRPRPLNGWEPSWGLPDHESCPAFGTKWCCRHDYKNAHHRAGVSYFRSQIQNLMEGMVDWMPYKEKFDKLSLRVHLDEDYWLARVPLIHFWIVEHHYPDRVMRQFGLHQTCPPPDPEPEVEVRCLHAIVHKGGYINWLDQHQRYVLLASEPGKSMVERNGDFSYTSLLSYRQWFQNCCMYTVFLGPEYLDFDNHPIQNFKDEVGDMGYIPSGPKDTRNVCSYSNFY